MSEIERRMLSGQPFTYGGLCAAFGDENARAIDRTIQRLRKKGLIAFQRMGRMVVWTSTDAARAALEAANG